MIIKEEFESKIGHLKSAIDSLKKSITFDLWDNSIKYADILRDSNIQRFEYCYELSWKFMKYILEKYDTEVETRSPKQALKTAFRIWYIDNLELWFKISEYRNKTSHEYEENIADELYENIPDFFEEMQRFYENINIKYNEGYFK